MSSARGHSVNIVPDEPDWGRLVRFMGRLLDEGVDFDFALDQVSKVACLDAVATGQLAFFARPKGSHPAKEATAAEVAAGSVQDPTDGPDRDFEAEADNEAELDELEVPHPEDFVASVRVEDLEAACAAGRRVLELDRWRENPERRVLSAEEEVGLCVMMRSETSLTGDLPEGYVTGLPQESEPYRAYAAMIVHNLKLVHKILRVSGLAAEGMAYDDLAQHGVIGLMHAVKKFNISKGFKFSTYATWWIRQSMSRGLANEGSFIRLPVHMRENVEKVRRAQEKMFLQGRTPDVTDLSLACRMPTKMVKDCLKLSRRRVVSTDFVVSENTTLGDLITHESYTLPGPEETLRSEFDRQELLPLLSALPERVCIAVLCRFGFIDGEPWTLEAVGEELGVTRERARQLANQGLQDLRIQLGLEPDDPASARRRLRAAKERARRSLEKSRRERHMIPEEGGSSADEAGSMTAGGRRADGDESAVVASESSFERWLADQMQLCGVTDVELAERLGVTRALVTAWLDGRSAPRPDVLGQVRSALLFVGDASQDAPEEEPSLVMPSVPAWYHRPAHMDGGREFGNAAAFAFDADLSVLAREATQNSLDEQHDRQRPVRVRYVLHELTGEHLGEFLDALGWEDLEPHYDVAAEQRQKVGRVLAESVRQLRGSDSLLLLRVEDYNATGLIGSEYGDSKFAAVVRDQLISNKTSTQAGGSYGLGKATLWGTSSVGLVLINSTLSVPHEGRTERRMVGRLELPWHTVDGEAYAGPAWFGVPDGGLGRENIARSWWGEAQTAEVLHLVRESPEPGTSFLVVGAHDASGDAESLEDMHKKLVKALADNFWAAMTSGRDTAPLLQASVTTLRNGHTLIEEERVDPAVTQSARVRALQAHYNAGTVDRLTDRNQVVRVHVPLRVPSLSSDTRPSNHVEHHAVLLVTPADDMDREVNRIVCMRGNRMSVVDRRVRELPLGATPFQAVLLAGRATGTDLRDAELAEAFLRAAEPPEHNDWNKTEELASTYARGARQRILDFRKAMDEAVRSVVGRRSQTSSGGPAALRELLQLGAPVIGRRVEGHPTIGHVQGSVDRLGAWRVEVEVKLPDRADAWVLQPVAKFDVSSGGRPQVVWAELTAGANCNVKGGLLHFVAGARRASFAGVTDVDSHPVSATMARLIIDLQKVRVTSG